MPRESILAEALKFSNDLQRGLISMNAVRNILRERCFAEPKVPVGKFLAVCRKYDPNFSPVVSAEKRAARAALSKKVQEGMLSQTVRELNVRPRGLDPEDEKKLERHHNILFRGCTPEQKKEIADMIIRDDKKALGQLYYDRVFSKKNQLYSMSSMSDEQLVDLYFENKDVLDLIVELQSFRRSCEFTDEQQKDIQEMFNKMGMIGDLERRLDVISNPYYANFYCEKLEMSAEDSSLFYNELRNLALRHNETLSGSNGIKLGGPTDELAKDYRGMRGWALNVLSQNLSDFVGQYGAKKDDCIWASEGGSVKLLDKLMDALNENELLFVHIPNVGIKALHNTGKGFLNCKPEEASDEAVREHMLRTAENGLDCIDAANHFFMVSLTGSSQYNQMEDKYKAVKELMPTLGSPPSEEDMVKALPVLQELTKSCNAYLTHKKEQGREVQDGIPVGRSANEQKRIDAALKTLKRAEAMTFQLQYQFNKDVADGMMQTQHDAKMAKNAKKAAPAQPSAPVSSNPPFEQHELCTKSPEELKKITESYTSMPACKPSNMGNAAVEFQKQISGDIGTLIKGTGLTTRLGDGNAKHFRTAMARIVLLDYVLRERNGNEQNRNSDTITAGLVETAINNKGFRLFTLVNDPKFKEAIGEMTPARIEKFLTQNESKKGLFDDAVRVALFPSLVNAPASQPLQQQPTTVINQPVRQPEPKPVVKQTGP